MFLIYIYYINLIFYFLRSRFFFFYSLISINVPVASKSFKTTGRTIVALQPHH